jgi:hypothetical protein
MSKGIDAFEIDIYGRKRKQLAFINENQGRGESPAFIEYLKQSVNYQYWHLLLAYPIANANFKHFHPESDAVAFSHAGEFR